MKKTILSFALLPVFSGILAIAQPPQGAQPGRGGRVCFDEGRCGDNLGGFRDLRLLVDIDYLEVVTAFEVFLAEVFDVFHGPHGILSIPRDVKA